MTNQKLLTVEHKTIKSWAISSGKMNLNFDINVEVKTDLVDFKDILKRALLLVEEEIKKHN